jgi:CRISPR system Cascade subunit CasE
MFLSRVEVSWGSAKNPYNLHRTIWKLFPGIQRESRTSVEESRQGFLFRVEQSEPGCPAIVMVQSRHEPQMVAEQARVMAFREFNPQPSRGQRLSFVVVANPVKTINDKAGRLNGKGEIKKCRVPLIKEEQQIQWLHDRLKGIATPEAVNVRKLPPIFFYKQKEKRDGKLVPILFEGVFRVEEPDMLMKALEDGIGPAKGFGCGLMLVRRV